MLQCDYAGAQKPARLRKAGGGQAMHSDLHATKSRHGSAAEATLRDLGPDARVEDIAIDALAKTVAIRLLGCPDARSRRVPLELLFQDVEAVTVDADMVEIRRDAEAALIEHCHLAAEAGASHIHMARGHVSVAARTAPELIRLHH